MPEQPAPSIPLGEDDASRYRGHPVHLDAFEGPLDLLLHLIRKDRIEIWQISVSRITRQYLEYLAEWRAMNLEVAGDFLVMAATLMRMKSQMLLPRPSFLAEGEGNDAPLTRDQLIQRLIEYRKIREAALRLRASEIRQGETYPRGVTMQLDEDYQLPLKEPRLVDLLSYLRELLTEKPAPPQHEVQLEEFRLEDQMEWVLSCLRVGDGMEPVPVEVTGGELLEGIRFSDLLRRVLSRQEIVVTLLAVLELAKHQRVRAWQARALSDIWLVPRAMDTANAGLAGTLHETA